MNNLLQLPETINYNAREKRLPIVDGLKILKECGKDLLILKAECGTGKTQSFYGLKKSLGVFHRVSLCDENRANFTEVVCINSLSKLYDLNKFNFILIDEWTAMSSNFQWEKIALHKLEIIKEYKGKLIFTDRDFAGEQSIREILGFTGRSDYHYHHHITGSREKPVLLTHDINEVVDQVRNLTGLKLICTDSKAKAKMLAKKDWGRKTSLVTTDSGISIERAMEEARYYHHNHLIIASPKVGEGCSINIPECVYNGYIWYNVEGILNPALRMQQAIMRFRPGHVARTICIQSQIRHFQEELDPEQLKKDYNAILKKSEAFKKLSDQLADAIQDEDFVETNHVIEQIKTLQGEHRGLYYEIWCNRVKTTNEQQKNITMALESELTNAGFTPVVSDSEFCTKVTQHKKKKKKEMREISNQLVIDKINELHQLGFLPKNPQFYAYKITNLEKVLQKTQSGGKLHPSDLTYEYDLTESHAACGLGVQLQQEEIDKIIWKSVQKRFFTGGHNNMLNMHSLLEPHSNKAELYELFHS